MKRNPMNRLRDRLAGISFLLAMLLCGCGGPKNPPTFPLSGIDGKPLTEATVSFIPSDGQSPANGTTDGSGRFTLTTFSQGDGAMQGNYRVTVMKFEKAEGAEVADTSDDNYDPNAVSKPPQNRVNKKYASAQTSGLTATVLAGPENSFEFNLEK